MAEIEHECPWIVDMWGIPICRLNVLPCKRVPQNLCDQKKERDKDDRKA